ncbi:restriction endonuclease subunit S [Paenibacillus hamazuiensis]|uniref:restriction endonuclease subunit S n=1 Tax=Paenibacillus hamazuiensis TaxID=2936508 RepID=UPI002010B503|nr:restriction endonuclease subunit S [Paenibacillus hamazuiensis]
MSKKDARSVEELLKEALVPEEEQPYQVPGNWVWVWFGYVARLINGYAFKSNDYCEDGIPVIRISDIKGLDTNTENAVKVPASLLDEKYLIRRGDLLIAMSGATTGKTGIYESDEIALQNQRVGNIKEIDENVLYRKYKNYFVIKSSQEIYELSYGGAQPNISGKMIESLKFPLPPLNEQKRIADKVERLLDKINQAKQLIEEAKETFELRRAAILDKAFRGELTKRWRVENTYHKSGKILLNEINELKLRKYNDDLAMATRNGEKRPQKIKTLTLKPKIDVELPPDWIYCSLGDIVYDFRYGTSSKSDYNNKGTPVLRIPNIGDTSIELDDLKYLSETEVDSSNTVSEGDILIIRSNGSKDLVGKCAIVGENCNGYAFASYLIRIRTIGVLPEYVYFLLKSESTRRQFFNKTKSSAGINNINTEELSSTLVPLPPYEEQIQIVKRIKELLYIEDSAIANIDLMSSFDSIISATLSKAFRGELGTNDATEDPVFA